MSINWFPGHMAKARQIEERAEKADVVIEILDAVFHTPRKSDARSVIGEKPRVLY